MGFGDDLMTAAIVRKAHQKTGKLVMVGDGNAIHWSEVFDGNPRMTRDIRPDSVWVRSWPGRRPYLDHTKSTPKNQAYNQTFKVDPGEIYLTDQELDWPQRDFVYIEPNVKREVFCGNKDWGFDRWQSVVDRLPAIRFVQGRGRSLRGVEQVASESFRHVAGLLSHADLFVGTDGGLHHTAAALGKPAVVVWGGLASPLNLGYDTHTNLHAGSKPCGSFGPCAHCRRELDRITVDMVVTAIAGNLRLKDSTDHVRFRELAGQRTDPRSHGSIVRELRSDTDEKVSSRGSTAQVS